jgi:NADPH-dependent F420 reductase
MEIGIIGGTGPAGRGLAVRSASAGHRVIIGSRDEARAGDVAAGLKEVNEGLELEILGGTNEQAAGGELVVLATPWDGAVSTAKGLSAALADRVVISMVNALVKEGREMLPLYPPRGSMAAQIAAALPASKLAAAFHHLPAAQMEDLSSGLQADVLVCGDDPEAKATAIALIESLDGLRGLDAGSLAQATPIEAFTAVCITLNILHKAHSTLQMTGL